MAGDVLQIGPGAAPEGHRNLDRPCRLVGNIPAGGKSLEHYGFDFIVSAPAWIEIDENRRKGRMQVQDAAGTL